MPSTSCWTPAHIASLDPGHQTAPLIAAPDVERIDAQLDIWDAWPAQRADGTPHVLGTGAQLWMALGAPRDPDPDARHALARIHLLRREPDGQWTHLGPAMPDGFSPGSREWSGSAIVDEDGKALTLYFTAAGRRGEDEPSFEQRLFQTRATLAEDGACGQWSIPREIIQVDGIHYMPTAGAGGGLGTIKAFRDPAWFRDPASGEQLIVFAASRAGSASAYNGVVGLAKASAAEGWAACPPILCADGLNNELERPHLLHRDGLYYLFWSTQAHVFDPAGPVGPTGLYGMVSGRIEHGWRPLNGSGLVFANPPAAPAQAYSWLVLPDLSVTSFVDDWGGTSERRFGATFAPFLHLWLDGDQAGLR